MNTGNTEVRRATTDDLPRLRTFLQKQKILPETVEKKLTEFQLAIAPSGEVVGIVGLRLAQQQGMVHSFHLAPDQEQLAPRLWERIQAVAKNHGLFRLWTPAPITGGQTWPEATAKELERLPEIFGSKTDRWHVLQLKEETAVSLSLDQEFALFTQSQKEGQEQMMRQARAFKIMAYVVAVIFAAFAALLIFKTVQYQSSKKGR